MLASSEKYACLLSIFGVQKQTVATNALFRRLGRERGLGGQKEIILQEMKTRLSQKLQKTNSPKVTHTDTYRLAGIHKNTHKYLVKQRRTHTQRQKYKHTHNCNWYLEFSLPVYLPVTHKQLCTDTQTTLVPSSRVRLAPDGPIVTGMLNNMQPNWPSVCESDICWEREKKVLAKKVAKPKIRSVSFSTRGMPKQGLVWFCIFRGFSLQALFSCCVMPVGGRWMQDSWRKLCNQTFTWCEETLWLWGCLLPMASRIALEKSSVSWRWLCAII